MKRLLLLVVVLASCAKAHPKLTSPDTLVFPLHAPDDFRVCVEQPTNILCIPLGELRRAIQQPKTKTWKIGLSASTGT